MKPFELEKTLKLFFSDDSADQLAQAYLLLSGLENMRVEQGNESNTLIIHYSIEHYSLEGLEKALLKEGFQFKEKNWRDKLDEILIHYCEDVQYHNLHTPEHITKKNQSDVFAKAYEHQAHGDHDATPSELREVK